MNFLAPGMLFALGAVAAPIILHFLNTTRVRRVRWAAMQFLRESIERNRRRMRIEDLLLLILRCLLIALLALAFARPIINAAKALLPSGAGPISSVLLLDNSMSMGQSDGLATRASQDREAAIQLIDKLAPGSECALFFVSDTVRKVIPEPTRDLALLKRNIETAEPVDRASNLLPGIRDAIELLRQHPGRPREISVVTDSQALAWQELPQILKLRDEIKTDIALRFITIGDQGEQNIAVSAISLDQTSAAANHPVRCTVEVSNWGNSPVTSTRVALSVDGAVSSAEGTIPTIPGGETRSILLLTQFGKPGYHTVTATIPPDRLSADNSRSTAVYIADSTRILIVEQSSSERPSDRGGFFLSRALAPVRDKESYYLQPEAISVTELNATRVNEAEIVVLANIARLTADQTVAIRKFVEAGGSLIIFPGPDTDTGFFNATPIFKEILPARLGPVRNLSTPVFLQKGGFTHPVTAIWNDPKSGTLDSVNFTRLYPLQIPPGSEATRIIATLADGQPAIVEKSVGKGHVVLFNSTANTVWNTLPLHPVFVPLLHRLVGYLRSGSQPAQVLAPGATFQQTVGAEYAGAEFSVLRLAPGEQKRVSGVAESIDGTVAIRLATADTSGAYQIFLRDESAPVAAFAVQTDPAESNLTLLSADKLALVNESLAQGENDREGNSTRPSEATELWMVLAVLALVIAIGESALAHHASRSH